MNDPAETAQDARAWLMVAVTFGTLVVTYGVWYSYSVFLVTLPALEAIYRRLLEKIARL